MLTVLDPPVLEPVSWIKPPSGVYWPATYFDATHIDARYVFAHPVFADWYNAYSAGARGTDIAYEPEGGKDQFHVYREWATLGRAPLFSTVDHLFTRLRCPLGVETFPEAAYLKRSRDGAPPEEQGVRRMVAEATTLFLAALRARELVESPRLAALPS